MKTQDFEPIQKQLGGISRRDFLKFCSVMAVGLGLPLSAGARIAQAIVNPKRTPVIWLSFQECTGCVESLLRSNHPTLEHLLLDLISLDYSETLCAAAGKQVEAAKARSIAENAHKFLLVVDGAVPTKDGGIYCKIAGRTALDILKETAPQAAAIVAMGSCASWGGVAAAAPNPTGAKGISEIITDRPIVSIPGCPPNPYNLLSTLLHFITYGKLPALDQKGRPQFAYSRLIHESCERRPHFDAGRFAMQFGDETHRSGYCLYKLGCKGPETYANCPSLLFGDAGTWPVGIGHPCFGCSEKGVGFSTPLHQMAELKNLTPPVFFGEAFPDKPGIAPNIKAFCTGGAGLVVGAAGAATLMSLGKNKPAPQKDGSGKDEQAAGDKEV